MKEMMRHEKSSQDACVYDAAQVFQSGIFNHYISNTAYPINHGQTINAYRLSSYDEILATVKDSRASIDTL